MILLNFVFGSGRLSLDLRWIVCLLLQQITRILLFFNIAYICLKCHAHGSAATILDFYRIVNALLWKDDLVKHDELFVAILAGSVLDILVLVVEHEADPLLDGIPEDLTSNTPVLCLVVALALKLLVISSFVEV